MINNYLCRDKHPNLKAIFALVMEALNHTKAIEAATSKVCTSLRKFSSSKFDLLSLEFLNLAKHIPMV